MTSLQIPEKPICILFSHGAVTLKSSSGAGGEPTCDFKYTQIPPKCQLATFLEPGVIFKGDATLISNFCKAPESRKTILEPLFLWHSPSDITVSSAEYIEYSTPPIIYPFTNSGLSVFELPKRANEGARVADIHFTIQHKIDTITSLLGLYVHMPNGTIRQYTPKQVSELPNPRLYLSEVYQFIQGQEDLWNPAVGVALVILSCQAYGYSNRRELQEKNIWLSPTIPEACHAVEMAQQEANVEYQSLDLLDKRQLRMAYPRLLFPVFTDIIDRAKGRVDPRKVNNVSALLFKFANENILPENIKAANRGEMVKWITNRQAFLNLVKTNKTLTSKQKSANIQRWNAEHPKPNNPVLVTRAAVAKAAEEQVKRNANAATRRAKANKEKSKYTKMLAARERKTYFQRFGAEAFEKKYGQPAPPNWLKGGSSRHRHTRKRRA